MKRVDLNEISMDNKDFWNTFFMMSYPNGYDEELDLSVGDIIYEFADIDWWNNFTGYYKEVFEESDGYLDEPTYIEAWINKDKQLIIEFHPGDILYYVNGENVGSTGPHWILQVFSYDEIEQMLKMQNGEELFWLLLPLAKISEQEVKNVAEKLEQKLKILFDISICKNITRCLVQQLIKE